MCLIYVVSVGARPIQLLVAGNETVPGVCLGKEELINLPNVSSAFKLLYNVVEVLA